MYRQKAMHRAQRQQMADTIIPPASPAEYVNYLLECGDLAAAYEWQAQKVAEGQAAALAGEPFRDCMPAAWQRGYVEALQDRAV